MKARHIAPLTLLVATLCAGACATSKTGIFDDGNFGGGGGTEQTQTGQGGHGGAAGSGGHVGAGGALGGGGPGGGAPDAGGVDAGGPCTTMLDCVAISDQCNQGSCVNGVCVKQPANEFGACDDGLFCTDNSACSNGVCGGGTPKVCPGADACHVGTCDEGAKKCTILPGNDGNSCSDGDPCTAVAVCQGGACVQQSQKDCSFLNGTCATGTCDPKKGCVAVPNKDGTPCDDGLYCTVNDACKAGACVGQPNTCAPPGDVCMIGTCDEGQKTCVAVPGNDGAKCSSGNACLAGETCSAGTCGGGKPANDGQSCAPADKCMVGTTCANGACGNPKSTITQCIDGDGCCPPSCPGDSDCCGNDCWGPTGCKTAAGHCIKFSCRAGTDGPTFCDKCMGWQEVSYSDWMKGGWCGDVIATYRAVENANTKCGSNVNGCCGTSASCAGSDNAWHFWDAPSAQTKFVGPCLGCAGDTNCAYWDGVESTGYTRLSVCKRY